MSKKIKISGKNEYFKVNNIFCIGKNYFEHIKEFGSSEKPEKPVVFLKPNSAVISNGERISVPEYNGRKISESLHYETEMVVAIGKDAACIKQEYAGDCIFGYGIGLDMTLRDVQGEAKKKGLPWGTAKGFHSSAPVSELVTKSATIDLMNLDIELKINNIRKQFGNTSAMIFNIYQLVSYISNIFYLQKGDLIFTGTPEGVGEVRRGDRLEAVLGDNLVKLNVEIDG
ncbi:MAG: fumarylacetoacetate hydrolase family protein [Bacteroidetes bacterium]|nr:fumarylacetoacetate hydrolase family protein [Bacteroidota bacterium]